MVIDANSSTYTMKRIPIGIRFFIEAGAEAEMLCYASLFDQVFCIAAPSNQYIAELPIY